jgi:hypothetical protein
MKENNLLFPIKHVNDEFNDEFNDKFDLEDLILFGMGEVVFELSEAFGVNSIEILLDDGNSIILNRPNEDPFVLFYDRLRDILNSAKLISEQNNILYNVIAAELLVLDGWSWNDVIFRAPIWMNDHREILVDDARKIKGLEWLENTSSAIKSKQNMVLDGLEK